MKAVTAEELMAGDTIVEAQRLTEVREIRRPGKIYVEGKKVIGKHGCTGIHVNGTFCYPPQMKVWIST